MPNHISNRLTVTGTTEQVAELLGAIKGEYKTGEERAIDFNRVIPMPEILKNTGSGTSTISGKKVNNWWTDNSVEWNDPDKKPNRLLTEEEKAEIAATGSENWYDWSCENWGTKWNAYEQERLSENAIAFQTAWATPLPVIEALAAKYPNMGFKLEYADEDIGNNAGVIHLTSGQITGGSELEGRDAVKLWFNLNPDCEPKEYGYDPKTFEYVGDEDEAA